MGTRLDAYELNHKCAIGVNLGTVLEQKTNNPFMIWFLFDWHVH